VDNGGNYSKLYSRIKDVSEKSSEENISTYDRGCNNRMEKTA
jgi:hypothetical protein